MEHFIDELAKLQELKEKGAITEAEFQLMKRELLDRLSGPDEAMDPDPVAAVIPPPPVSPAEESPQAARPSKRGRLLVLAIAVAIVVVGGAALVMSGGDDAPKTIEVIYTVEVVTTEYCADFSETGYDDLPRAEAEVVDGSGKLLGFGTLDEGVDSDSSCVFTAKFTIDRSSDGKYRATAGNTNRGYISYTGDDVVDGVLNIDAIIGE